MGTLEFKASGSVSADGLGRVCRCASVALGQPWFSVMHLRPVTSFPFLLVLFLLRGTGLPLVPVPPALAYPGGPRPCPQPRSAAHCPWAAFLQRPPLPSFFPGAMSMLGSRLLVSLWARDFFSDSDIFLPTLPGVSPRFAGFHGWRRVGASSLCVHSEEGPGASVGVARWIILVGKNVAVT